MKTSDEWLPRAIADYAWEGHGEFRNATVRDRLQGWRSVQRCATGARSICRDDSDGTIPELPRRIRHPHQFYGLYNCTYSTMVNTIDPSPPGNVWLAPPFVATVTELPLGPALPPPPPPKGLPPPPP
jgi:hypothetical protein